MNATAERTLTYIRASGTPGIEVRNLTRTLRTLAAAGLVTITPGTPITRHGAASHAFRVTAN